jgi:hypothetical protein
VAVGDTVYALRLDSVLRADPKADAAGVNQVREQVQRSIAGDLNQQFVTALWKDIGVSVNRAQIEQQFSSGQ